jgi:hypothetical protein
MSAQLKVKELKKWAKEYEIKNIKSNKLEPGRNELPMLNMHPLTAIQGIFIKSMSSSVEVSNKLQSAKANCGKAKELKDDYQLNKDIRMKEHDLNFCPTMKELHVRNQLSEKNDMQSMFRDQVQTGMDIKYHSNIKAAKPESDGEFLREKHLDVEATADDKSDKQLNPQKKYLLEHSNLLHSQELRIDILEREMTRLMALFESLVVKLHKQKSVIADNEMLLRLDKTSSFKDHEPLGVQQESEQFKRNTLEISKTLKRTHNHLDWIEQQSQVSRQMKRGVRNRNKPNREEVIYDHEKKKF